MPRIAVMSIVVVLAAGLLLAGGVLFAQVRDFGKPNPWPGESEFVELPDDSSDSSSDSSSDDCDVCPDSDGDGVQDADDACAGFDDALDEDGDAIPDGCDTCFGLNATGDSNNDGMCDSEDHCEAGQYCLGSPDKLSIYIKPWLNEIKKKRADPTLGDVCADGLGACLDEYLVTNTYADSPIATACGANQVLLDCSLVNACEDSNNPGCDACPTCSCLVDACDGCTAKFYDNKGTYLDDCDWSQPQ